MNDKQAIGHNIFCTRPSSSLIRHLLYNHCSLTRRFRLFLFLWLFCHCSLTPSNLLLLLLLILHLLQVVLRLFLPLLLFLLPFSSFFFFLSNFSLLFLLLFPCCQGKYDRPSWWRWTYLYYRLGHANISTLRTIQIEYNNLLSPSSHGHT